MTTQHIRPLSGRRFSMQEMMVVVGIIAILAAISIPSLVSSKQRGNESAGVAGLKAIHAAQARYRELKERYGDMAALEADAGLDKVLATGKRDGFFFRVVVGPEPANQWVAFAWPQAWGVSADRMFLIERTGRVVMTSRQVVTDDASADAFVGGHAFFSSYDLLDMQGWQYLDGGVIGESDPGGGDPGGGGGGGDPGAGCSLALPR